MNSLGLGCVAKPEVIGVPTNNVAYTIFYFTYRCISNAELHCEVNLTIVGAEDKMEAVIKDNILNRSNIQVE